MKSPGTDERRKFMHFALIFSLAILPQNFPASAGPLPAHHQPAARDGSHDFDWDYGIWETHQRRRLHPLTGSNTWVEYKGTDTVRKIWDGTNSGTIAAAGPAGRLDIFTIRQYDPSARQWNIYFVTPGGGITKPAIGEFVNGRADFYDQEAYNGRFILLRFSVSDITPKSCHFEQAFSDDGGKTWEVNFIVDENRADG